MAERGSDFDGAELVARDGDSVRVIATLDEALAYLKHEDRMQRANREGVLFRLEAARTADERRDAANAFRGWLDATGLLVEARPAR
jgi:hypothetical protein